MTSYRYAHEIAFLGNDGTSYGPYALAHNRYRRLSDAQAEAQKADGCGRAYGAFARKIRVSLDDYALAK